MTMLNLPLIRRRRRPRPAAAALALAACVALTDAARGQQAERFVGDAAAAGSGTLELRPRAVVAGADVRLRHVCRWSDADAAAFAPIADLCVDHLDAGGQSKQLGTDELRAVLRDAGVNIASVRLGGAATCAVSRDITAADAADVPGPVVPAPVAAGTPSKPPADVPVSGRDLAAVECNAFHTLRERLAIDLSQRLGLAVTDLQVTFAAADANLLNLAEPAFRFQIDPRRVRDLGRVSWDVTVMAGGVTQHASVAADARAWQRQLVMTTAAAYHQVLRAEDVTERRVLVDHVPDADAAPLARHQAVGQQAARDLKAGAVLTPKLIDPVPLARVGQYVTVTLAQGGVQVRTVAKALEAGSYGQTIKVKDDASRDVFEVTLTGPQVASMGTAGGDGADANLASDRD